jgi:pimeloyl-ACP methyl ester carboxylesterase
VDGPRAASVVNETPAYPAPPAFETPGAVRYPSAWSRRAACDSRCVEISTPDGTRLAARRSGHGEPVVLVHGSGGGLDSWEPVTPLLADEFELWVYARRGYPPSDGCRRPKTYADDVADLRAVLAAAGGTAHIVGGSYGATVALHAAYGDGSAIRSLTLFEPPLYAAGPAVTAVLDEFRGLLDAGEVAAAMRLFAAEVARVPAEILAALAEAGADADADAEPGADADADIDADAAPGAEADATRRAAAEAVGCLHDLEAMAADPLDVQRWAGIDVPVLLMQGGATWAPMPATMEALAGVLSGVERAVLAGQAHFATHTAPERFVEPLRRFLRGGGR